MTFFKNLFRRSKDDDDEDLADDEAFGIDDDGDDDDRLHAQAIMDDEYDLDTDSLSGGDEDDLDTDSPSGDEEHFGTSGELSSDGHDDNDPVAMGGSDYEAEPDDGLLDMDTTTGAANGPTGTTSAELYVHIPLSVKDAPAGTVPILIFGHGIFGEPGGYFSSESDADGMLALTDAAGFIAIGTVWRGLTARDRIEALDAAAD